MMQLVSPDLARGVSLWGTRLVRCADDWGLLDARERARAERFVFDVHRDRFVAGRAGLRRLLGDAIGQRPEALVLVLGPQGKPALLDGGLEFNLSHSEDVAVFALGGVGVALGVDVEAQRPFSDAERRSLSAVSFAVAERAAVEREPDANQAFFRVWSRKEAVIKALGDGIGYGLTRFCVSATPAARLLSFDDPHESVARWTLNSLELPLALQTPGGVAAALATRKLDTPHGLT